MPEVFGIDFGARRAGTTAYCVLSNKSFIIEQSAKNKDADEFLRQAVNLYRPSLICIDAPLSLPMVYRDEYSAYNDYHYRNCDREAGAMSPLFLGGLTARAMALAATWKAMGIQVIEVYPGGLVKQLDMEKHYKEEVTKFLSGLPDPVQTHEIPALQSWHQVDALLAWYSGCRYQGKVHVTLGDLKEGQIVI